MLNINLNFRDASPFEEKLHPRSHGKFSAKGKADPLPKVADLKKVGGQLGSNPGGRYQAPDGSEHYVKLSKSPDHARNEVLAGHLYQAAGAPVIQSRLMDAGGGHLATSTEWAPGVKNINPTDPEQRRAAQKHFAAHAWLANWDAAGLDYDNQGTVAGRMTTLDPGGSLLYRAQGGPKGAAFGNSVGEWDTLRHPSNKQAHKIFGGMSPTDLRASAARVAAVPDKTIRDLVDEHGPGTPEQKKSLADRMIARRNDVAKRATSAS